jgi:AbrB family looped-hinge helix DNA binding protein
MAASSRISRNGQVTIPIEIRHHLGLKEGDKVEFVLDRGRIFLRPAQPERNPFEAYVGALPAFSSRKEINAWIRQMRGEDLE